MNSIDNLRDYVLTAPSICSTTRAILVGYVDSIDAEHQKVLDEWKVEYGQMWLKGYSECHAELLEGNETLASDLERCGWIRLPVDADGEPIHVGDVMEWVDEPGITRTVTSIQLANDGWWVYISGTGRRPDKYRHHHAPTVEDVLREFAAQVNPSWRVTELPNATLAEYAAKLRLAEEVDE